MGLHKVSIEHDGGVHNVEIVDNRDGTVTICFGASFTLRLDEHNLDKLREAIHMASRDLIADKQPNYPGRPNLKVPPAPESLDAINDAVEDFDKSVTGVEDAVEAMKEELTRPDGKSDDDTWAPNDPINW